MDSKATLIARTTPVLRINVHSHDQKCFLTSPGWAIPVPHETESLSTAEYCGAAGKEIFLLACCGICRLHWSLYAEDNNFLPCAGNVSEHRDGAEHWRPLDASW